MSDNIEALYPSEMKKAIRYQFQTGNAPFIWGQPGIGKSDIVRQIGEMYSTKDENGEIVKECPVVDIRLLLLEATDLRGIPYRDPEQNLMKWSHPGELPSSDTKGPVIIFLDELTAAPPTVQGAAYQLILDRKIGTYKLPEDAMIVAAGNRQQDRGVFFKMPKPLSNRFVHYELKTRQEDWLSWAIKNNQHPDVIGYISERGSALNDFDPKKSDQRAFATPRTWKFVSDTCKINDIENIDRRIFRSMITGAVGDGSAAEFLGWLQENKDLPKIAEIFAGTATVKDKIKMSGQYYVASLVTYEINKLYLKDKTSKHFETSFENALTFVEKHLCTELRVMVFRYMIANYEMDFTGKAKEIFRSKLSPLSDLVIKSIDN